MATMRNSASFGRGTGARRSAEWFDRRDLDGYAPILAQIFRRHRRGFRGRPVIGICNSWSELVNCNVTCAVSPRR